MSAKPHIVGIVGNDITNDSRVKKTAAAAAAAGYESTILCYTTGTRRESMMGDVRVIRVPVPFYVRDWRKRVAAPARVFAGAEITARHMGSRSALAARKRRLRAQKAAGKNVTIPYFFARSKTLAQEKLFTARHRWNLTFDKVLRRMFLLRTRAFLKVSNPVRDHVGHLLDYEYIFGPELDALAPDLIHAHDVHMIGVAVNSARMLAAEGHSTKVLYDAHELVEGLSYPPETIAGWLKEEESYIHEVDAVTGVSPEQVALIKQRYSLPKLPVVVLNAPIRPPAFAAPERSVAADMPEGRTIVYHGNVAEERGVFTILEALVDLPDDVNLAYLAPAGHPVVDEIYSRCDALELNERVRLLPYVAQAELPSYLSTADLAVVPYHSTGNNDIALPNKLFESIHAGLPVLVTNVPSLSRFITESGIGLVARPNDPKDLAEKAAAMLNGTTEFADAVTEALKDEVSWHAQAKKLLGVYDRLLGQREDRSEFVLDADSVVEASAALGDKALAVGPQNMAGQAYQIARVVRELYDMDATSFDLINTGFRFPADTAITVTEWRHPLWQREQQQRFADEFTHILAESGTGMLGSANGGFVATQMSLLEGQKVAILLHGSEIRDPRRHRLSAYSPYASGEPIVKELEVSTKRLRQHLASLDVPVFVTTPDLLLDAPDARWLPVVVDMDYWAEVEPLEKRVRPRVLHRPTNGLLKGSSYIDEVLQRLDAEGLIEYQRSTEVVQPADMRELVAAADIVIDGIVLGAYGVMAVQSLAAGRIAVANLSQLGTLQSNCPIVHASPSNLEVAMRALVDEQSQWDQRIDAGLEFVRKYHDGRYSAQVLGPFLES